MTKNKGVGAETARRSQSLARVIRGDLCAGCGGCAALVPEKIQVERDARGLFRPMQQQALTADEDKKLHETCVGLGQRLEKTAGAGGRWHPLWGPVAAVRRGWAKDRALRHRGASGGALSAVAASLLASGRVDAVLQVTADPDQPWGNRNQISGTPAEVLACAGSRYAPSAPLTELPACLEAFRRTGTRFALLAKPCDAAMLRALAAKEPELAQAFPVILSFFCGGVPSGEGAAALLAAMGLSTEGLSELRYRGMGWPGETVARMQDGREARMTYAKAWGNVLSRHVQHRCKICADSSGMAADLVCADAWEADAEGYPLFEEQPGQSLIMARTALGQALLQEAEAADFITTEPFELAKLAALQPGQRKRRRAVLARLFAQWSAGLPVPRFRGLGLWACARRDGLRSNLRSFLGMLRRLPAKGATARPLRSEAGAGS